MSMRRVVCLSIVLAFLVGNRCFGNEYYTEWWTRGPSGMEGLGDIQKISPQATNWLHWGGAPNYSGEYACFYITVAPSGLKDCDTYHVRYNYNGQEYSYCVNRAGDWYPWLYIWKADNERMPGSGLLAPARVDNGIDIECWAYDYGSYEDHGLVKSIDGGGGEMQYRKWGQTLQSYKVGCEMMPSSYIMYEDDTAATRAGLLKNNLAELFCSAETTYLGTTTKTASGKWENITCTWKTVTDPPGAVMLGSIWISPFFKAEGLLDMECWGDGLDFGDVSNLIAEIAGVVGSYFPGGGTGGYIRAGTKIIETLARNGSDANIGIAAQSIIQWVDEGRGTTAIEHWVGFANWTPVFVASFGLGALDASGFAKDIGPESGQTWEGSVAVSTEVFANDHNFDMYHGARVKDGGSENVYLKFGTGRPVYGPR